ncbi:TadE/TadG family type IV pilus assembly protein [Paenarthrobacter nicotinovorans]|uniref:TadE/TadG family type IV pilus assembly protein n=1 Tax=Paenarthrobacter nicotinovorans TaxID=29320 RepID=UPI0016427384|nr:TadE/TadG family type IV pilus assembly protein [Paenarthrobacter nicotinovorans]
MTAEPGDKEAGTTTLESIIILPLILGFFLVVLQFALVAHASNLAHQAATAAVAESRRSTGTAAGGETRAQELLRQSGADVLLQGYQVSITRNAQTTSVTVSGKAVSFVPWMNGIPVTETISGPVERWVPRQ